MSHNKSRVGVGVPQIKQGPRIPGNMRYGRELDFWSYLENLFRNAHSRDEYFDCLEHKGDMSSFHNFTGDAKETFELVL